MCFAYSPADRMHALIALQVFEGCWTASKELAVILDMSENDLSAGKAGNIWCTIVLFKVLEDYLSEEEGAGLKLLRKLKDG